MPPFQPCINPGCSDLSYAVCSASLRISVTSSLDASTVPPVLVATSILPSAVVTGPTTVFPFFRSVCGLFGFTTDQRHFLFGRFHGAPGLGGDFNLAIGGGDRADHRFPILPICMRFVRLHYGSASLPLWTLPRCPRSWWRLQSCHRRW